MPKCPDCQADLIEFPFNERMIWIHGYTPIDCHLKKKDGVKLTLEIIDPIMIEWFQNEIKRKMPLKDRIARTLWGLIGAFKGVN